MMEEAIINTRIGFLDLDLDFEELPYDTDPRPSCRVPPGVLRRTRPRRALRSMAPFRRAQSGGYMQGDVDAAFYFHSIGSRGSCVC